MADINEQSFHAEGFDANELNLVQLEMGRKVGALTANIEDIFATLDHILQSWSGGQAITLWNDNQSELFDKASWFDEKYLLLGEMSAQWLLGTKQGHTESQLRGKAYKLAPLPENEKITYNFATYADDKKTLETCYSEICYTLGELEVFCNANPIFATKESLIAYQEEYEKFAKPYSNTIQEILNNIIKSVEQSFTIYSTMATEELNDINDVFNSNN